MMIFVESDKGHEGRDEGKEIIVTNCRDENMGFLNWEECAIINFSLAKRRSFGADDVVT